MDLRKLAVLLLPLAVPLACLADSTMLPKGPISGTNLALSADASNLEEGKALYENGQMIAALGKFMTVLRSDPHNDEARQYLRLIVDTMRQNPSISSSQMGQQQALAANPEVQEEIRKMLQRRGSLTLDLKAIPSVQAEVNGNVNRLIIDTSLLFADNSGGLKEQGVPLLDRAAAWLKTYGQQPVIIHCYPEELADPNTNGALFLHRYSELFNFFVEEKKLLAQRFVSADLLKTGEPGSDGATDSVAVSTTPHVVIETIGTQTAMLDELPSASSSRGMSQWIEDSILPNRRSFNPQEGEWVNLDLAALTRAGLRSWTFTIVPASANATAGQPHKKKTANSVLEANGTGNLLKRLSWDGRDQKTGSFVRAGSYIAKLAAVNSDGTIKYQEETLQVERPSASPEGSADLVESSQPKTTPKRKAKPVQIAKVEPSASSPAVAGGTDNMESLVDGTTETLGDDNGSADSTHTIWKQVVQFEPNRSELLPTLKTSLERIGKTLEVYPLQKVRITGFAMTSEANPDLLARQRAETVRAILVNDYHVDQNRVIVAGGKTSAAENASKVEMSITN